MNHGSDPNDGQLMSQPSSRSSRQKPVESSDVRLPLDGLLRVRGLLRTLIRCFYNLEQIPSWDRQDARNTEKPQLWVLRC